MVSTTVDTFHTIIIVGERIREERMKGVKNERRKERRWMKEGREKRFVFNSLVLLFIITLMTELKIHFDSIEPLLL